MRQWGLNTQTYTHSHTHYQKTREGFQTQNKVCFLFHSLSPEDEREWNSDSLLFFQIGVTDWQS